MTPDQIAEVVAEALDSHKARTQAVCKIDRGRLLDGRPYVVVSLPGGTAVRVTVQEEDWG